MVGRQEPTSTLVACDLLPSLDWPPNCAVDDRCSVSCSCHLHLCASAESSWPMAYIPLHERQLTLDFSVSPGYASPLSLEMEADAGESSRKRRREDDHHQPVNGDQVKRRPQAAPRPPARIDAHTPIAPSIFGIAPRNELTRVVGDFILQHCRGVEHVEIEIKLGTVFRQGDDRRFQVMSLNETIMPPDVPLGKFASTIRKDNHATLNRLLNSTVESSQHSPTPLRFFRAQQVDSFYSARGGKVRVSRDRAGNVVPDGVVRKRRLGDLNVVSPREPFDFRISANVEEPAEMPEGEPTGVREKDRACYRHQCCQVDLTVVTTRDDPSGPPKISYECEIEVLNVPQLIAEGEKEERGEPNRFDEMLQNVLDTARMLVKNVF